MKLKILFLTVLFIIASCNSQAGDPTVASAVLPTETSLPTATATAVSTETSLPAETSTSVPGDIFGAIPLNSVQAFSIEPVAQAIFDETLQGYVTAGTVQEFRVDSIAVFPSGDGDLIAEIMYSLRTDNDPWPDDFGTAGSDGWITGKCSRFDLVATETEHQLKNKRLCS